MNQRQTSANLQIGVTLTHLNPTTAASVRDRFTKIEYELDMLHAELQTDPGMSECDVEWTLTSTHTALLEAGPF